MALGMDLEVPLEEVVMEQLLLWPAQLEPVEGFLCLQKATPPEKKARAELLCCQPPQNAQKVLGFELGDVGIC